MSKKTNKINTPKISKKHKRLGVLKNNSIIEVGAGYKISDKHPDADELLIILERIRNEGCRTLIVA